MRALFIFLVVSVLYIGSVFWVSQGRAFRLDSDYDSNLPIISYVAHTMRNEKRLPFWNPYVTTGISVLGDPLSGVTYLPYLLPLLTFGVPDGWWVVIGLHAFLAGAFMWMWLRELLAEKPGFEFPLWGGLLYMGAGAFAARVAAGHIEKVLSYPWYPLFLMLIFKKEQTLRSAALTGAVMGAVFLTGDVYAVFFMMMLYGVIGVIRGISPLRGVKEIGVVMAAFVIVGAIKLVPFIFEVTPLMSRYSSFDAARGSIQAWFTWIPFVVPWGVSFYDRPAFQRLFGFWYNWYEYYSFIGLPILLLVGLPRIIKRREVRLLLMLLIVGLMYIARGYPYSIFYWMADSVSVFASFRVPQRMYGALTSVVVALIILSGERFIRKTPALLWGMLLVTFLVSGYQMTQAFEKPRRDEETVVRKLRARDNGDMSVATFSCCMQTFLVRERIRVTNYYYGWLPKSAPRFTTTDGSAFSFEAIRTTRPTYIIAPKDMVFRQYGYEVWFGEGNIVVWRASTITNYIWPGLPKS